MGEERRNVILAALAEVSALYLDPKAADGNNTVDPTRSRTGGWIWQ